MVVDEEQRFGVKQKELLRQLKLKVDVMAMSATPIPRTLQMSLAGMRDISVIETPPEGRRPVKTYVGEYDEALVKQAIMREKERGGQAFFVHNRVETIDETAERLRGLCPGRALRGRPRPDGREAPRAAHAELPARRGRRLVATSIIESGIDIPQANTLIIERAETFGWPSSTRSAGASGARASAPTPTCSTPAPPR
jgi:transcription-repair coupling factor (superfamily II helicase)